MEEKKDSLNVCALISGGKDSFYSALLTKKQGHNIVALVNLAPRQDTHDIDSQCFQTVGYRVVPAYEKATGIPLFRGFTNGRAICSSLDYNELIDENDEVEDLYQLLSQLLIDRPDLKNNALVCGAIASTYQYNRISNIGQRLNLVVLTPMWQQNDDILMDDIVNSGIEAIIVKVASAGLNDSHVGDTISKSMISQFSQLKHTYGMNMCGEGGEYESLVLYCPLLFKKRISIKKSSKIFLDMNPYAPVVVLDIESYFLSSLLE